jgi:hypothetical protein
MPGKMKLLRPLFCLLTCVLFGAASAAPVWTESFEGAFPPAGWSTNSADQVTTYALSGLCSARLNATTDYLITPPVSNAQTLIFWSYTTASDPGIVAEYAPALSGP